MNREEVSTQLKSIFESVFEREFEWNEEISARNLSNWDSIAQVNLIVAIEGHFALRFRLGEAEGLLQVGQLLDSIEQKIQERQ